MSDTMSVPIIIESLNHIRIASGIHRHKAWAHRLNYTLAKKGWMDQEYIPPHGVALESVLKLNSEIHI